MNRFLTKMISLITAVMLMLGSIACPVLGEEIKQYDTKTGYPLLEDVKALLDEDEIVKPKDATVDYGSVFELIDKSWLGKEDETPKLQIRVCCVESADGDGFSTDIAGTYTIYYVVEPQSGHPAYEISRCVIVMEPEEVESAETIADEVETIDTSTDETTEHLNENNSEMGADMPDEEPNNDESDILPSDGAEESSDSKGQENAPQETSADETQETIPNGESEDASGDLTPEAVHAGNPDESETADASTEGVSEEHAESLPSDSEAEDEITVPQETETSTDDEGTNDPTEKSNNIDVAEEESQSQIAKPDDALATQEPDSLPVETVPVEEGDAGSVSENIDETEEMGTDIENNNEAPSNDEPGNSESSAVDSSDNQPDNGASDDEDPGVSEPGDDEPTDDAPAEDDPENIVIEGNAKLKRGDKIKYPADLGDYSTFLYKVDGKIAYCLESKAASPKDGSFAQAIFDSNNNLSKALYYGYGGAGDISGEFFPDYNGNVRYILTHMASSYFYTGDFAAATYKCTSSGIEKYRIREWIQYLSDLPDPPSPVLSLTKTELGITRNDDGTQITELTTLRGDNRNHITIEIPDGITFHNESTGKTQKGGTVQIAGGTKFFFSAPASMDGNWFSGELSGSVDKVWKAIVITTGTKTQDLGSYASEIYSGSVRFTVSWQGETELKIIKADAANDELRLSGAVIGVYADSTCSELLSEATTGDDGTVNVSIARAYKTVYIKELSAPEGYRLKDTIYTVELGDNASVSVLVKNEAQTAGLKIYKQGEMLTDAEITDNGVTFIYRLKKLIGAEYRVTTLGNIYGSDGALLYQKGSVLVENAQTNASGEVFIENLPLGQYLVEETKAPDGYVLSGENHTVTLEYAGQEAAVAFDETTFTNERQKAEITAYKTDANTKKPLSGAQIGLYAMEDIYNDTGKVVVSAGTLIENVTTGADGSARFTADLPIGYSYRIEETKAPDGYLLDGKDCLFRFAYESQNKALIDYRCEFADCPIMAKLHICKVDAETTTAQGDASLSGAVYGLYAGESITVPDGSAIAFGKDAQVTTLITDKNGEATITGLYPGRYYLKEITPSTGYVLDPNTYEVICQPDGDTEAIADITVKEQVAKQPFQIIKAAKNAGTDAPLLKGAGFSAWLISDLNVQPDGDYDFSSVSPVAIGPNGATEIFTDDRGYAVTVPLPYGTYIVRETTTPDNYAPVDDFIVHITENAPSSPQVWRVLLDQEFSAKLRIVKIDVETGRTILLPGASFTVYDLTNNQYVSQVTTYPTPAMHTTFETDASGTLMLPEALRPGRYRVTEVSAPSGYLLNPLSVDVTVGEDSAYKIDPLTNEPVIEVKLSDTAVEGRIHISKIGEMLTGYRDGKFVYENCYISGVTLEVYAAETIYTPDGQKDETGERFPLILEGTLVDTLVTDANGDAWMRDLPLGKYYIIEKQTADGFVLDDEKHYVTLSYADQETAVVVETLTLENLRQKVEVHAEKLSSNGKLHLSGATFALYTRTAIMLNGSVLVPAGTCVATATTDSTGFAAFEADLPLGEYLLNEIQAPAGYIKSDGITEIDLRYKGQDAKTASASVSMINEPVRVAISKADATTGVELDGAKLTLKDKNGRAIESWVSVAGSPHMVEGLTIGETYTLKEEIAPYGYLISNEIRFTVNGDNTVQKVVMRDNVPTGSIIINKSGEFLSDVSSWDSTKGWIGNKFEYIFGSLKDVTFDVYAYADITHADGATAPYYTAGTKIATIRTDSSGYARLDNLPLGKYYVVETGTASGYLLDDEARIIDLSYRDSSTPVVTYSESWQNERKRVHIKLNKTAESTGDALAGAAFGLYAGENISVNGKTIIQKGALIEQKATDVTGKLTFETDLPIGYEFAIREVMPPAGYVNSTDIVSFRTDDGSPDTLEVRFVDTVTRLEISKADIAGEELPGAKLTILNSKGETVESWVSGDKPHYVEMLPVGKYTLREESAPEGYMIAEDISFEVRDTGEIQKVTMQDKLAPVDHETPKTGDDHSRYLWLLPVATGWMGVALVLWYGRRRKRH